MENGNDGGDGGVNQNISCDDVISKLKDDGDFDRLRIKIIRKIKENEELRKSIVSIVKQSEAINCPGAENTKPRQLSDAIHQEVGGKLNEHISAVLWEMIRSPDGMKTEITETVESVYDKLSRPKRARVDREPQEHPGFSRVSHQIEVINPVAVDNLPMEEQQKEVIHRSVQVLENDGSRDANHEQGDGSDEDLDAPPGFG
ncbi:hypothetical protein L1987_14189 [Smallanthus sonchifolius]|uniref:Uncharacterized protein n=1 Tax=Smallanthus sonchifolius TaxID=185202 RepID=A0ACB9J2X8_9ASTR|nr:hypothetical protein L1987_14189 [Smallanthus sonchifolius]